MTTPARFGPRAADAACVALAAFAFLATLAALAGAVGPLARLVAGEFRVEAFSRPTDMRELLPTSIESPRYLALFQLARRIPPGALGMRHDTWRALAMREREKNPLAHVGFEAIVETTGGPVRYRDRPPASVRLEARFLSELGLADGATSETIAARGAVAWFEDMGVFPVEGRAP